MDRPRILVAEDQINVAMDILRRLQRLGYDVLAVVTSGEEAIHKAAETRPDLALVDIELPGEIDGVEAAKKIRGRFEIPAVYLTAHVDDQTFQRAGRGSARCSHQTIRRSRIVRHRDGPA